MTSAALIFTRSDSIRLPQKFRAKIGGLPLLELIVRRATQLSCDIIIVATSDRSIDDEIEDIVKALAPKLSKKVYCLRGAFEDVVLRTRQAIESYQVTSFCRINGDSPFFPIGELNDAFALLSAGYSFVNNIRERSYPYGVAVEVMNSVFFNSHLHLVDPINKEHITSHLYLSIKFDKEIVLKNNEDWSKFELVVDTADDLVNLQALVNKLSMDLMDMSYRDLFALAQGSEGNEC